MQDNLILICRSVLSTSSFSRCGRRGRSSCTRTAKISSTRSSATGRGTSVTITRNSSSSASPMRFRRPPCGRGRQPTKWTAARLHRRRLRSWREAVARGPLGQSNNTVAGIDLECRAQCLSVTTACSSRGAVVRVLLNLVTGHLSEGSFVRNVKCTCADSEI